jgi:hypothetical protein
LTGLGILLIAQEREYSDYLPAGVTIWVGAIVCYFFSGVIVREVGGIPLSMGRGGWKVRRTRSGRYRE